MEVTGRIKKIFEEQTFASGFRKKEIVLTTTEQYPQDLLIDFTQDKIELLKSFNINDEVKISINLKGREWINPEGVAKYFNGINGWRIERVGETTDIPTHQEPPFIPQTEYQPEPESDNTEDDLPF